MMKMLMNFWRVYLKVVLEKGLNLEEFKSKGNDFIEL